MKVKKGDLVKHKGTNKIGVVISKRLNNVQVNFGGIPMKKKWGNMTKLDLHWWDKNNRANAVTVDVKYLEGLIE